MEGEGLIMNVILADEKHGTVVYSCALSIVRDRLDDGYWYDEKAAAAAQKIWENRDESAAWRFLRGRNDHEYERVEQVVVRG